MLIVTWSFNCLLKIFIISHLKLNKWVQRKKMFLALSYLIKVDIPENQPTDHDTNI